MQMDFSRLTTEDIEDLRILGFSIYNKIGQGTFSQVYSASYSPVNEADAFEAQPYCAGPLAQLSTIKKMTKKNLACKVVGKSFEMPRNYPHRYIQRELNIIKQLNHPYIPRFHSILRKGPKFLVFMECAKKGNLCDFIINSRPVTEPVAKRWLRQLSLALIYLHTMDIAHRDISCDNILLTEGFNVQLTDFGYSCFNVTPHGWPRYFDTHCGSLPYVAPEVIRGLPYNPKYCDIWSLGVVLFVMLNGTLPFSAHSYEHQYNEQMERKYSYRKQIRKTISASAIDKVAEMLDPNPLLRTSLQEIVESPWMESTNTQISSETLKTEKKSQQRAKNIKEEMEMCRGKPKKFSIQYPWIKIEKETYWERLSNLKKRHVNKIKIKSVSISQEGGQIMLFKSGTGVSTSPTIPSTVTVKPSTTSLFDESSINQVQIEENRKPTGRTCVLS